jgi:hypothetical protein
MKISILFSLLMASALLTQIAVAQDQTALPPLAPAASAPRRNYFLGIRDLSQWTRTAGQSPRELVLTSPHISVPLAWNELIPSWNAALPPGAYLKVEMSVTHGATATKPARTTKFYCLGKWSMDPARYPRESVKGQKDADGDVETDTLVQNERGGSVQLRLTFGGDEKVGLSGAELVPLLRFVGLAFTDKTVAKAAENSNHAAWGKTVPVPERFQMDFKAEGGAVWCSPTSVSMILAHWSELTKRRELTMTVPQVAHAVLDPQWPGTGNWAFNAAFAGSFPGMRAYVTRFDDLRELEDWIAAGVPVALSVNYGLLKGDDDKGGGHLVVCNGFTAEGDVIIADPGRKPIEGEKYRVFPRANVQAGWGASGNTVYLIYPETFAPPSNSMGHWEDSKG